MQAFGYQIALPVTARMPYEKRGTVASHIMSTKKKIAGEPAGPATRASDSGAVDAFMQKLEHPLKDVAETLRREILGAGKHVGEEIFWNAPTFFYTGKMNPFPPKEYRRYIVGFNFFRKNCIRLIFLRGAMVKDPGGLLEGEYTDGRRLALFTSMEDVKEKRKALKDVIKQLLAIIPNL